MTTPMTVIGGFLGSGKTTLLNYVLQHADGVRYAVLVNDFGEISLDDRLVVEHGGDTVRFANGCLCCTLGDNLLDTVDRLLAAPDPPDQFLIEASGVADPVLIADVAVLHPDLHRDLVVVLCDATSVQERAADARLSDTVTRQLEAADIIVMNHCDRLSEQAQKDTLTWLQAQAGSCVIPSTRACIDLDSLNATKLPRTRPAVESNRKALEHPFFTRVVRGCVPDDGDALTERLAALGPSVVRAKGLLRSCQSPARWWSVNKAGNYVQCDAADDLGARGGASEIVLLALEPLADEGTLVQSLGLKPD